MSEFHQRDFKGVWIPRHIYLNKELSVMEKILLTEIDSLSKQEIGCIASNSYLAEFLNIHKSGVSKLVKSLSEKGYISVELEYDGAQIIQRKIYVLNFDLGGGAKMHQGGARGGANLQQGWCKFGKDINTYKDHINSNTLLNTQNTTIQEKEKYKKEKAKTQNNLLPDVSELMVFGVSELRKLNFDESFDYHLRTKIESWIESGGKDGNGKQIKNWKSKIKNVIPYLKPVKTPPKQQNLAKKEFVNTIPREEW